jgi:plastocyanin
VSDRRLSLLIATLASIAACADDRADATHQQARSSHSATVDASKDVTAGTIRGRAIFEGIPPSPPPVLLGAQDGCGSLRESAPFEKLIVREGGVANVLIRVKRGLPAGQSWPTQSEPVVLDQRGCVFEPHVLVARVGAPVSLRNSDPLSHNVHVRPSNPANEAVNLTLAPSAKESALLFAAPELAIPVRCDIHPWMQAVLHVVEDPFYALSDANGAFELRGLPAGEYELEACHEWLGRFTFSVPLSEAEGAEVLVRMSAPN